MKPETINFKEYLNKQKENLEFQKEYEDLSSEYEEIKKKIIKKEKANETRNTQ